MIYVHEFVDELDCERCPHNAPADEESGWGDFDFVCLARDDEFIFPEGCPAYLGPWGAWRAGLAVVEDAARHEGEMGNLKRIAKAVNTLGAVGWWSP